MLNLWNSGFSKVDSIHIHNNMPGGNNTSTRPVSKPGQPNPVKMSVNCHTQKVLWLYKIWQSLEKITFAS
jgi:hypothetical protein